MFLLLTLKTLPAGLGLFAEIDPFETDEIPEYLQSCELGTLYEEETELCTDGADDESDWELEEPENRKLFDMLDE